MRDIGRRTWIALAVAAGLAIVVGALVLSGGEDEPLVVPYGQGTVTVDTSDEDSGIATTRATWVALIEQSGYPPEVVECYRREINEIPEAEMLSQIEAAAAAESPAPPRPR